MISERLVVQAFACLENGGFGLWTSKRENYEPDGGLQSEEGELVSTYVDCEFRKSMGV